MAAPTLLKQKADVSHAVVIMWTGSEDIIDAIENYVKRFEYEDPTKTFWAGIVDPRFDVRAIMDYIKELGGEPYIYPPQQYP